MAAVEPSETGDAAEVRPIMSRYAGVLRSADGLRSAMDALAPMAANNGAASLALMMTASMLRREESRGGHSRTDFPTRRPELAVRTRITLGEAMETRAHYPHTLSA